MNEKVQIFSLDKSLLEFYLKEVKDEQYKTNKYFLYV